MGEELNYAIVKICLIGDSGVGKTSLIRRYVYDMFDDKYIQTIGTKVTKKEIHLKMDGRGVRVTLMLWDILGQKKHFFSNAYFRGAAGAIFVADLTNKGSMDNFQFWYKSFTRVRGTERPVIVLLNKLDLVDEQEFDKDYAKAILEDFGDFDVIYTSAKTGEGVERAFTATANAIVRGMIK